MHDPRHGRGIGKGAEKMIGNLYPPSIQGAPPELTVPSKAYRRQVVVVLLSLAVFVLFYLALIVGSGWLIVTGLTMYGAAENSQTGHSDSGSYLAMAFLSAVLFLFLVKALFKWHKNEDDLRIEITPAEQPELFGFIQKICAETHAPKPYRVFLAADVNAAVFYNSSVLSLFLPVKKNLLIGLGLVNGLNLSEFKAVLAHEFGHFSQSSMRLGSYVYMANHIIYDLVYRRDKFDDMLAQAKRLNIRIAIFAYIIYGVLWVLRKILQGAFKLINIFESALSRQMEFHADLVAVSVTGSDSLIHALKKLEFANACLMQAAHDLKAASAHRIYTQDIYYHQTQTVDYLRKIATDETPGAIPALPADPKQKTQLFTKDDDTESEEGMWASHPSHFLREQNAKRVYIRSADDERSPWILFRNPGELRQRMTREFYQKNLEVPQQTALVPAEQVQQFIDGEHAETTQDPRYLGIYDGRLLSIPTDQLTAYANDPALSTMTPVQFDAVFNRLYDAEYKDWLEAHKKRREEHDVLEALGEGDSKKKGGHVEFRGRQYSKSDVKALLEMVEKELEADAEWLKAFDREVFQTHLRVAQLQHEGDEDLYQRYYFQLNLQDVLQVAVEERFRLRNLFRFLATKESSLSQEQFRQVLGTLIKSHQAIAAAYGKTRTFPLPRLQNMQEGQALSDFLLPEMFIPPLPSNVSSIDSNWVSSYGKQLSQIEERCRRLYFKSMGAILARQEAIAGTYRSRESEVEPTLHGDIQAGL